MDDFPFHDPLGPAYVRPIPASCPDCGCCTRALCEKGRANPPGCVGSTNAPDQIRRKVAECPCDRGPGTPKGMIAEASAARVAEIYERLQPGA